MKRRVLLLSASLTVMVVAALTLVGSSYAATFNPIPTPAPIPSSYGLEATKKTPPPTQGATITTPGNGASFGDSPITVSGICPRDLLVQVYNNGVMVGSAFCTNGSFSVQVSLFVGTNELSALVFDAIDQQGPESNKVTVNYTNTSFTAFGQLITLTSNFGRRAANPNTPLNWPLQLSGGTGPYAFSINWGDGSNAQLKSQASPGVVDISHTYKQAGIYTVTVTVTDVNGATAFLQLIAVANGKPVANAANASDSEKGTTTVTRVLWIPALVSMVLLLPTYWLGRRSQVVTLRKQLQKNVENYKEL